MTWQSLAPIESLHGSATNRTVRELVNLVNDGSMTFDLPYQRGSVWTIDQRIGLIRSFLQGVPIPALIVSDRLHPRWRGEALDGVFYALIDGKQRMETMVMWMRGDFAVPASWWRSDLIDSTEETNDGPYLRYTTLTDIGRRLFDRASLLPMCEARLSSVHQESDIYLLVNGQGTAQSRADIALAAIIASS